MLLDAAPRNPPPPELGVSLNHSRLILTKDVNDRYVKRAGSEAIFRSAPLTIPSSRLGGTHVEPASKASWYCARNLRKQVGLMNLFVWVKIAILCSGSLSEPGFAPYQRHW